MDYQVLFNTISLQLLIFTLCSAIVVLFSTLAIRLNPLFGEWSRYWLLCYILAFLSLFPIALIPFDNSYLYALKDVITINQAHSFIHAATDDFIPNNDVDVALFIKLILAIVLISTLRALIIFAIKTNRVITLIQNAKQISFIEGMSDSQRQEIEDRRIKLLITQDIPPLAYGFFSKIILIPKTIEAMSAAHKQMLIEHELQHHRKNDTRIVIVLRLLTGLFWFNPFIHYLERKFILSMESNCDKAVIKSLGISAADYAQSLISCLKICQHSNNSCLTAYFSSPNSLKEELEWRIRKMMASMQVPSAFPRKQVVALSLFTALVIVFVKSSFFVLDYKTENEGQMPITNGFISFDYNESKQNPHFGIDIQAAKGTKVKASFTGRVIVADDSSLAKGLGVTVLVEQKDNATSLYANLGQVFVSVGQIIKAGEVIGTLGDTLGQADEHKIKPHLHFEISKSGKHLNPTKYLNGYDK